MTRSPHHRNGSCPTLAVIGVAVLARAGYAGYRGMEFLPGNDVLGDLRTALTEFKSFAK
jgi:hypothetical protein